MKTACFFICFIFLFPPLHSQQFHSLDGVEDTQGNTLLIYRLGSEQYHTNPIFKLNAHTGYEQKIMEAHEIYYPIGADIKTVVDFEFFPGDTANFMNIGDIIFMDYGSYIAKNDSLVFGHFSPFDRVDISKQDPQKVFVFGGGGGPVRSWDGGNTFPEDSIPLIANFAPIALSDFDDDVMFGFDEELEFCKNSGVVDTSFVAVDDYFRMFYDVNQFHIYRVNYTYGGYSLNVSNNKGDAFTWTKTYQSENPVFVSIDPSQSGLVYLADGRRIYKSVNNGYTFTEYKALPGKLIGIYKKPNSEILYAASRKYIYKITPDSITIIKSIPVPVEAYGWFPLAVGNIWVYDSYSLEGISSEFTGTKYMKIVADTLIENKNYFVIENEFTIAAVFPNLMFLRIDSATGLVYRYWIELDNEYIFHDLIAEVGDIIYNPFDPNEPFYFLQYEQPTNYLGLNTYLRSYSENALCTCHHNLIKGFGLVNTYFLEVYGEENILKGCVIDGVVYGDTTFVVDVEEEHDPIPTEYKLEQNYPNPFNPSTTISWQSPVGSWQTLKVYDVLGNEVAILVDEYRNAGSYNVQFTINNLQLSSGIYFYQLKAGNVVQTKKMLLIK
jgi:hypothetical protein